jgi:hypothetical protein
MGILHRDEFLAEMTCVTDPQPRLDPRSLELQAHRRRWRGARTRWAGTPGPSPRHERAPGRQFQLEP